MQKRLAAELLNVGEGKVKFDTSRIDDILQAITRADIHELIKDKAIMKRITGKSKPKKEKKERREGSIHLVVKNGKRKYINKIRKIRRYLSSIKDQLSKEEYNKLRRLSKSGHFKSRRHIKEHLTNVMKKSIKEVKFIKGEKNK